MPYENSLQARDTTPARARTFAGPRERGRPGKPGVVTVSHQPTTPQHTQLSLAVTCVTTHCKQVNSEPHAMLANPQQHGNTCDDEGIPTHSAPLAGISSNSDLCGVIPRMSPTVFLARQQTIHKCWWAFSCFLAFFRQFFIRTHQ